MPTIKRELEASFEDVMQRIPDALKTEGFGILSEIDVAATLKTKLGVERRPYSILGACNPTLANRALEGDLDVGVLLPCNVVVYETETKTVLSAVDPLAAMGPFGDAALREIALDVHSRLSRVLERMG
ncbi:MAG: DUF302 domain-containing protein [Myxococcota bacterium]